MLKTIAEVSPGLPGFVEESGLPLVLGSLTSVLEFRDFRPRQRIVGPVSATILAASNNPPATKLT
jgi:hypothetical protein